MANAETITNAAPTATTPAHALWRIAVAAYEQSKAAEAAAEEALDAASAAYRAEVPDRADEFMAYGLNRYGRDDDREKLILAAQVAITLRDYKSKGKDYPNAEEYAEIAREATHAVDEFAAWRKADHEASERIYGDTQERFDDACSKRWDATKKLLVTAAPDTDAMLYKLELLAKIEREHDTDDADSIEAIRDDAKRLLGGR